MARGLCQDEFSCGNVTPWYQKEVSNSHVPFHTGVYGSWDLDWRNLTEFHAMQLDQIMHDDHAESEMESTKQNCYNSARRGQSFPLLDLPFEVRLQVYQWLHLMHPVKGQQLTPWYPTPAFNAYSLQIIHPRLHVTREESCLTTSAQAIEYATSREIGGRNETRLLSSHRPMAGVPAAFMSANKQIYSECREIPLVENEFIFVNWFASGLWAARSFVKSLQPWQQNKMRYVRLEVLSKDLTGGYEAEWQELCGLWSKGLRGMRLKILGGGGTFGDWAADGLPQKGAPVVEVNDSRGKLQHWVEHGLKSLKELRNLEVELVVADWSDGRKLEWCKILEEALSDMGAKTRQVKVICVERRV